MTDLSQLQPSYIRANGLEFAYLEAVPEGVEDAPLVLCLHGFPDTAWSFRPLISRLAEAGYRAVAVFMRGYAPTALAADGDYSGLTLGRDVLALIEHFGAESAYVVGHDWGALATYAAATMRPDRVRGIVTAGLPHPRRFFLRPSRAQIKASHYIFTFQRRRHSERLVMRDDYAWLRELVKSWSIDWMPDDQYWSEVRASFFERPRLRAVLGYYRAIPGLLLRRDGWRYLMQPVSVPARVIYGDQDGCMLPATFQDQGHLFAAGFSQVRLDGVGHFMHLQAPDRFAAAVLEGLTQA